MIDSTNEKPCLIKTEQGFSIQYKSKFLYSKYNPSKNILTILQNLQVLPGTIILCFSPALNYGLQELLKKIEENCIVIAVEADKNLYEFEEQNVFTDSLKNNPLMTFVSPEKLFALPELISSINKGQFRRCIRIDFSGGTQFYQDLYSKLFQACQNSVAQFWKNRITLVKFGRRYCANIFRNLKLFCSSNNIVKTNKPILVIGAGESALETLLSIKNKKSRFFILAVDAILQTMKSLNIRPDAVICEEAQDIIIRAFTGCSDFYDYLFVSASTNPNVTKLTPGKNIFYTTKFCESDFLSEMIKNQLLTDVIPPLGSVGLSAVETALKIRQDENIPVYITGMDFSYSIGQTHAKGSFHEKIRRFNNNRLIGVESFGSSFNDDAKKIIDKNNNPIITTTTLNNYSQLFSYRYSGTKNLFDVGKSGINLNISAKEIAECDNTNENFTITSQRKKSDKQIEEFILQEKNALLRLKDIFTGKIVLNEDSRKEEIIKLLKKREYLFLHFPDGYQLNLSQDFLNRIRVQIDFFLKILK